MKICNIGNYVNVIKNSFACRVRYYADFRNIKMESKPVLYGDEISPPVRFVMITASILKMELDYRRIDLFNMEQRTESFIKINPLQKVPALVVGDEVICDSHAIALYICGNTNSKALYPMEPLKRAKVDQMMFFNSSTLFQIDSSIFTEYFSGNPVDWNKSENWYSALDYLEYRLNKHVWLGGDEVTLCDICCGTTVSSLQLLVPTTDRHPKVRKWMARLEQSSFFELNQQGLEKLSEAVINIKESSS